MPPFITASSTKKNGSRWHSPTSANRPAASARWRPVRIPRASTPRYTSDSESAIENEYSPAIVESMLPPMMLPVPMTAPPFG